MRNNIDLLWHHIDILQVVAHYITDCSSPPVVHDFVSWSLLVFVFIFFFILKSWKLYTGHTWTQPHPSPKTRINNIFIKFVITYNQNSVSTTNQNDWLLSALFTLWCEQNAHDACKLDFSPAFFSSLAWSTAPKDGLSMLQRICTITHFKSFKIQCSFCCLLL